MTFYKGACIELKLSFRLYLQLLFVCREGEEVCDDNEWIGMKPERKTKQEKKYWKIAYKIEIDVCATPKLSYKKCSA